MSLRTGGLWSSLEQLLTLMRPLSLPLPPTRHPLGLRSQGFDRSKVIFAVLENKLWIYKRNQKAYKMYLFLPKYMLSVLRFGGAWKVFSREIWVELIYRFVLFFHRNTLVLVINFSSRVREIILCYQKQEGLRSKWALSPRGRRASVSSSAASDTQGAVGHQLLKQTLSRQCFLSPYFL